MPNYSVIEMFKIIQAFPGNYPSIHLSLTDEWYVQDQLEIGGDGFLRSVVDWKPTPEEAIRAHFEIITNLPSNRHIRCKGKRFRWRGCVWSEEASNA